MEGIPKKSETTEINIEEEQIDDGLGILLKQKTLYHGSSTPGIEKFNVAEDDTVGTGLYFTSRPEDAIGYARGRAEQRKTESPVLYASQVENLKILDLRKDENVKKVLPGFKKLLEDELQEPDLGWAKQGTLQAAIEKINTGAVHSGNLREIAWSHGTSWTDYIKSLGYDGLVTLEGGEGEYVKNHDSYVIFDPEKAKIIKEEKIAV
jgi:hypothetical protein